MIGPLALVLVLLMLPSAAHGAGELDPAFDGDGRVVTDFGGFEDAGAVAIQADGKIVAAGESQSSAAGPLDFLLARYNPDGSLDPTFSGDGRVVTDFGGQDFAGGVAIQADGKIVAAGLGRSGDFAVARYHPDGSLDTSFDGDGKLLTDFGGHEAAFDIAIQADGRLVVAGFSGSITGPFDFALARYKTDGSLDASFNGDGRVVTDFGADDDASDVTIQADGKIVAAGESGADFALARYTTDGSLDASFDGDGRVVTDFGTFDSGRAVAIQADGKIVTAGSSGASAPTLNFALARYHPDGSLDPTFEGDGRVVTDFGGFDLASGVAIQADGRIVAAGRSDAGADPFDFALARYDPDGSLDANFDDDGRVLTDFGEDDVALGVTIQADGKIVAAGGGGDNVDFALARYLPTGPTKPKISVDDVTRFEGNAGLTNFTFTVSLSKPSSETVTVSRETANGSASAPSDYTALAPATLTFSPGQTTKTVTVKVKGELAIESNETFFVNLSSPTNATIADGEGKGTIVNDDLSASSPCTITGTEGDDVLTGSSGNDVICGGNGNDQLFGLGGGDVLKGENGNDLLVGGNGVDLLVGSTGADDLRGESGNDTLRGGDTGDDKLNGGADSDALFGNGGTDSLNTQDGVSANDSADGGSGSDSCVFDPGDFVTSCP